MTRTFRYILIAGGALMSILLFLLASAADNTGLFEQNYSLLLGLNILVSLALFVLIAFMIIRLFKRYRQGRFGTRLMMRLLLLFVLIGTIPSLVIYATSVQFVSRSIESWFNVQVEAALDSGVKLGQNILESSLSDLNAKADQLALELSSKNLSDQILMLSNLHANNSNLSATLLTSSGHVLATSNPNYQNLVPDLPNASILQQTLTTSRYSAIESEDITEQEKNSVSLKLRVLVLIPQSVGLSYQNKNHFLQLISTIPTTLATDAEALRLAYSEYQVRSLSRSGLKKIYIVTLTLTLLLAVFAATIAAIQIASDLTHPLLLLARGTKAISEGNLSPQKTIDTSDELGSLIQSFNDMTQQLSEAQKQTEKSRNELEAAKARLESVLINMSAGVIVFNHLFEIVSFNPQVSRILRLDLTPYIGTPLSLLPHLEPLCESIQKAFSELSAKSAASVENDTNPHWKRQIEISHSDQKEKHDIMLLARGSSIPVDGKKGYIVVFDDITEIISAQRSVAWGEVARRLAHEIKNPLTPIQLSAERLQMKLSQKLEDNDVQILEKSTKTIVNQVTAMKRMVDDFRDYARTPPAQLSPIDLNSLIEDVINLYTENQANDIVKSQYEQDLPLIMGDETQLRQVTHNLLQNALDATTEVAENPSEIVVTTEKVTYHDATNESKIAVRLTVKDNGPGFQNKILTRVFEPYITTKEHGTGLGMAVVKKIIDDHHGRIDIENRKDTHGAIVSILFLQLANETVQ